MGGSWFAPAVLLVLIVAAPTATVLWLLREATSNERLAVRQRLLEAYHAHLHSARDQIQRDWRQQRFAITEILNAKPAPQAFAEIVRSGWVDSVVILGRESSPGYPGDASSAELAPPEQDPVWLAAERLEFAEGNPIGAANLYARIAETATNPNVAAQAIRSQVRCYTVANQPKQAVELLASKIADPRLFDSLDGNGRSVWCDLALTLMELSREADPSVSQHAATVTAERLNDYRRVPPGSAQRRVAMRMVALAWPEQGKFPTLAAEELAARFLEVQASTGGGTATRMTAEGHLVTPLEDRAFLLLTFDRVHSLLAQSVAGRPPLANMRLELLAPHTPEPGEELSMSLGDDLPGWRIRLAADGEDPFSRGAEGRSGLYLWTATLTLLSTVCMTILAARALFHQSRLTRLKNDLLATVTHELKTPLSSMRLLVDTLLEKDEIDPRQTREYLNLIARENLRLSHLIEKFLAFSRLERGKQRLEPCALDPVEATRQAVDSLGDRLHAVNCRFSLEIAPGLPAVLADREALSTILINLLDNALKYTPDEKRIRLTVQRRDNAIRWAVTDNGIGLSKRDQARIFDRFFQVNQQLSRSEGGCGLGLSIVANLARLQSGTIEVESELGAGSTFVVQLPIAEFRSSPELTT